jgi:hypothetical protein
MHSMPPGGFRLAIVNCWNPKTGFKVREQLALMFHSTPPPPTPLHQSENQVQDLVEL